MRRLFLAVLVLSALNAAAAVRSRAARVPCMVASGLPGFYISRDEGRTFTVNFDPVPVNAGVHIALSDVVNRLYAAFEDGVFQSSDGGCTWSLRGRVGAGFWMGVAAAPGGGAYAWGDRLLFIDAASLQMRTMPDPAPLAFAVDRDDARHLVTVGRRRIFESFDGGATWSDNGVVPEIGIAGAAIDPSDLRHLVGGYRNPWVSRDAGRTWQEGTSAGALFFHAAFSPSDPNVIWSVGSVPFEGRVLLRSIDGGINFRRVADAFHSRVVAHRFDPESAVVPGFEGLAFIDAGGGVSLRRSREWDDVVFAPAPGVLYLTTHNTIIKDP